MRCPAPSFIFFDLGDCGGGEVWNIVAAADLIVCALTTLYVMAAMVFVGFGWKRPLGEGWLAK